MTAEPETPASFQGLPVVDAAAMRALDFDATARFGVPSSRLMENAGRAVAEETRAFLKARGAAPRLVVCCGRGANGGDGLVAARCLLAAGASVTVFLCPAKAGTEYPELVRSSLDAARRAGVDVREAGPRAGLKDALASCGAALDALLGTGSRGKPAGAIHHMIEELNRSGKPVVALDLPSGLDPDTGERGGACVAAALTLTLGLPKRGLLAAGARRFVGELKVLDIGYPAELLREVKPA